MPPGRVAQAIADRRSKVAEFQLIREAADALGLRVWLFGGTAAGFAHYVRWDLERVAGDPRYPAIFFDYDFTNIYRSTQDADLVVDGTPAQAAALENLVREKMSFLQGSKEHWEVRLLRRDRVAPGGQVKQALLSNPDFLGQHTDSNSTGMIELTEPPPGETVIRDLRDWESAKPVFLQDVAAGRLHYYWSGTHGETTRAKEGHNPPLFSVIRYLVKAFQYGLKIEGQDRARIQRIIDEFDPQGDPAAMSGWAQGWLERYGVNLIRHAVDIEYARRTLEELGLRRKLIALSSPSQQGSLGWWLSREPLRTFPVGEGHGATARELGLEVVAHETGEFVDYESITRDMTGRPNVLISREGFPGELAVLGPGFYTRMGRSGARGTGLTVRFQVDPRAREGTDFTVHGEVIVFHNRAALTVIAEALDVSLVDYFQMLRHRVVDHSDRGVGMKLKRRLALKAPSPGDEEKLLSIVTEAIRDQGAEVPRALLAEWFERPSALDHPEVVRMLIDLVRPGEGESLHPAGEMETFLAWKVLRRPEWIAYPELVRALIGRSPLANDVVMQGILSLPAWAGHPELVEAILQDGRMAKWALALLLERDWSHHPEFLQAVRAELSADRAHSTLAWTLAYREAAFAVSRASSREPGMPRYPHSLRLDQIQSSPDGRVGYSSLGRYAEEVPGRSGPPHETLLAWMAGVYAGLMASEKAGLPEVLPHDRSFVSFHADDGTLSFGERDLLWIREIAQAYLVQGNLWGQIDGTHNGLPADAWGDRPWTERYRGVTISEKLRRERDALILEAAARAREVVEAHWPAVQALAQALVREEAGLPAPAIEEIIQRSSPSDDLAGWTRVVAGLQHVASGNEPECP